MIAIISEVGVRNRAPSVCFIYFWKLDKNSLEEEKTKGSKVVNVFLHSGIVVSVSSKLFQRNQVKSLGGKFDHPCFRTWR